MATSICNKGRPSLSRLRRLQRGTTKPDVRSSNGPPPSYRGTSPINWSDTINVQSPCRALIYRSGRPQGHGSLRAPRPTRVESLRVVVGARLGPRSQVRPVGSVDHPFRPGRQWYPRSQGPSDRSNTFPVRTPATNPRPTPRLTGDGSTSGVLDLSFASLPLRRSGPGPFQAVTVPGMTVDGPRRPRVPRCLPRFHGTTGTVVLSTVHFSPLGFGQSGPNKPGVVPVPTLSSGPVGSRVSEGPERTQRPHKTKSKPNDVPSGDTSLGETHHKPPMKVSPPRTRGEDQGEIRNGHKFGPFLSVSYPVVTDEASLSLALCPSNAPSLRGL